MRQDQAQVLGEALQAHNPTIVRHWLEQVQRDVERGGRDVAPTDLRDGVGDYLHRLGEALRTADGRDTNGAAAWKTVAREHALTRVRLGFDIEQLVHEFIVLRRSVMHVLREKGVVLDANGTTLLADLIDAAIAIAVRSYIDSRDYQARMQEAEHIGFVTHELRNPLTTATLAATQLQNDSALQPGYGKVLGLLGKGLDRMKELIDKVLLTEKLDIGALEPQIKDVRVTDIIEESIHAARAEAESKRLQFEVTYDPNLVVRADPGLATSALQNLADNAVKFTDAGQVTISVEDRGAEVVIHVSDTCSGLSAEELATIFEPFRRGHSGKPGTGLGLAIASRAIRAQGGHIDAESRQEEGCHFSITLPKGEAQQWTRS